MDLKDSTINGFEPDGINYHNATTYVRAVNELNDQFDSGEINCIHKNFAPLWELFLSSGICGECVPSSRRIRAVTIWRQFVLALGCLMEVHVE